MVIVSSSLFCALAMATSLLSAAPAAKPRERAPGSFESLSGYGAMVQTLVSRQLKADALPEGSGSPIEPGMLTLVSSDGIAVFDEFAAVLRDGRPVDTQRAAACEGTCPLSLFEVFSRAYARLVDESARLGSEMPSRVLVGASRSVPALTVLDAMYTAAETWPRLPVPNMYLLVSRGGVIVAKNISLLPPGGLAVSRRSQPLALRITARADGSFDVSGGDPAFGAAVTLANTADLLQGLAILKKRYPNKRAFILEPDQSISMGQYLAAMETIQTVFDKVVLARAEQLVTLD